MSIWKTATRPLRKYARWLHTGFPAGTVEKLPIVREDGSTNVSGVYIAGDLTGIPLLKFSADTGARVVQSIVNDRSFQNRDRTSQKEGREVLDLAIVGAGVSGMSAALEAREHELNFAVFEATEPFSTIVNFPKAKPIYTYPTEMEPAGRMHFRAEVKEPLIEELHEQTLEQGIEPRKQRVERVRRKGDWIEVSIAGGDPVYAHRVLVAIGRSGNFRKLGVPGEDKDKVYNRLHDPKDFCDQNALVVGGGDSAMETAIALVKCGAHVTLSYRKPEFSRPKPDNVEAINRLAVNPADRDANVEQPVSERITTAAGNFLKQENGERGTLQLAMATELKEIRDDEAVIVDKNDHETTIDNDVVFSMIGREPPLDFFRRSGIRIKGERTFGWWASLTAFLIFCVWMYHWKKPGANIAPFPPFSWIAQIGDWWKTQGLFPYGLSEWWASLGPLFEDPSTLPGTLSISVEEPGFYYSLIYCLCVVAFGIDRIVRRKTPYITTQTMVLMAIQVIPLFLLPYVLLPWMGNNGWFDAGIGKTIADNLFPEVNYGHGRAYWRAFGLILAWPLFIWNVFTPDPMAWWLIISVIQTFIIIPVIIYFWGKGAYCGWICTCGALAETMGDRHRTKMPHGPVWNRANMIGQVFLLFALALLIFRSIGWAMGEGSWAASSFNYLFETAPFINYVWMVDLLWAGILGVGLYFWFSGRVWCRFACPLAALMHIYHKFSTFRILSEKKKCISCNVCTSVCHQGIDVMNFANKGLPMSDVECVRCSACVQSCPTGVLYFGRVNRDNVEIGRDTLGASPVRMREQ